MDAVERGHPYRSPNAPQEYLTSLQANSIDAILERLDREVGSLQGGVGPLYDAE